jgi:hypothetical protein
MGTTTGTLLALFFPYLQRPTPSTKQHQIFYYVTDFETILIFYRIAAITLR